VRGIKRKLLQIGKYERELTKAKEAELAGAFSSDFRNDHPYLEHYEKFLDEKVQREIDTARRSPDFWFG